MAQQGGDPDPIPLPPPAPQASQRANQKELISFLSTPPPPPTTGVSNHNILGIGTTSKPSWRSRGGAGIPDPVFTRKWAVFLVLALCVWAFYVVVGRVCYPLLQGSTSTGMSSSVGAGTLVGFVILWLIFVWSYLKIVTTGPGFARDVVPKTPAPGVVTDNFIPYNPPSGLPSSNNAPLGPSPPQLPRDHDPDPSKYTSVQTSFIPSESTTKSQHQANGQSQETYQFKNVEAELIKLPHNHTLPPRQEEREEDEGPDPSEFAPVSNMIQDLTRSLSNNQSSSTTLTSRDPPHPHQSSQGNKPITEIGESSFQIGDGEEDVERSAGLNGVGGGQGKKKKVKDWRELERPVPLVHVGRRWCRFCEIDKPDRTHHCRHCGTCVLAFDRMSFTHCWNEAIHLLRSLWIGRCVGHRNHKFFIVFNFWGMLFCSYIMVVLVIFLAKSSVIDGQVLGLVVVTALFTLFTSLMFTSHLHLTLTSQTTVESFASRDQYEQESQVLTTEYGILWNNQTKRRVRKRWIEEWGGSGVGERWKWGSVMERWRWEMGDEVWGWFLPIGRPKGDGITFNQNPKFGPNGEWLKKNDWPKGVS